MQSVILPRNVRAVWMVWLLFGLFWLASRSCNNNNNNNNNHSVHALALSSATSASAERRKSPALWRLLEYTNDDDDDDNQQDDNTTIDCSGSSRSRSLKKPLVMAPAGGFPQLYAAVAAGADAVYVGLSAFSARARATNFDARQLKEAVDYAHSHGNQPHVYVAMNTLVFDTEWPTVQPWIQACVDAGVDAVIVQDLGLARYIQKLVPPKDDAAATNAASLLPIHSSTQQTVTNADGVQFCANHHGATRVVLSRELSVSEIARTIAQTRKRSSSSSSTIGGGADSKDTEIEVFCHGALCVSYSGQCFSSESWGGRSANRGQCAQACRLPYDILVDGEILQPKGNNNNNNKSTNVNDIVNNIDNTMRYVLSPQDLCGLEHVPQLVKAGVSCLKIEGRLKDASYVAATTAAYRQAVDEAWEALQREREEEEQESENNNRSPVTDNSQKNSKNNNVEITRQDLVQLFARGQDEHHDGLTSGFLAGTQHQTVVRGRSPRHRGVHMGRIVEQGTNPQTGWIVIQLDDNNTDRSNDRPLKRGDGLVVDRGLAQEQELGGPIYEIQHFEDNIVRVQLSRDATRLWQTHERNQDILAPAGAHVWRTHDAAVAKKFRKLATAKPSSQLQQQQSPSSSERSSSSNIVTVRVQGSLNEPLQVVFTNDSQEVVVGKSSQSLQAATGAGLTVEQIRKAVGTLGNTNLVLNDSVQVDENILQQKLWCPVSQIKQARRQAVEGWQEAHTQGRTDEDDSMVTTAKSGTALKSSSPPKLNDITPEELLEEILSSENAKDVMRSNENDTEPRLSILCRTFNQVDTVCKLVQNQDEDKAGMISEIVIDFLELDGMREAMERIRQVPTVRAVVASPRILKPEEGGIWKSLLTLRPDALLVRSTGLLHRMQSLGGQGSLVNVGTAQQEEWVNIPELLGDFSLNVANALTAAELLHAGLDRVTTSYDLNARSILQMAELLQSSAKRLEIVVHCHMPIFHTEHCVFARFLTKGNSYLDCGHVCTRANVHLRDELTGLDNLVLADMGCRNTVFAAQAQSGLYSLQEWNRAGIRLFRIELVDEDQENAELVVSTYIDVLRGESKPSQAWETLQYIRDSNGRAAGVSLGSFRNVKERKAGEL